MKDYDENPIFPQKPDNSTLTEVDARLIQFFRRKSEEERLNRIFNIALKNFEVYAKMHEGDHSDEEEE